MAQCEISKRTQANQFVNITRDIETALSKMAVDQNGLLNIFLQHTSASLVITENSDPDVLRDLITTTERFAPRDANYRHRAEGEDDMPAHIMNATWGASLNIPVVKGRVALGTWQGIFLCEHRDQPHHRKIILTIIV